MQFHQRVTRQQQKQLLINKIKIVIENAPNLGAFSVMRSRSFCPSVIVYLEGTSNGKERRINHRPHGYSRVHSCQAGNPGRSDSGGRGGGHSTAFAT